MQITTLNFGLTRNLGNYQSARLDIEARLEPWEDWRQTLQHLKVLVADCIGINDHDCISISDQDLRLSGELQAMLNLVRDKRSEVEKLKRELRQLDNEIQKLDNFKELVNELLQQSYAVSENSRDVEASIKGTMGNLNQLLTIWNGIKPEAQETKGAYLSPSINDVDVNHYLNSHDEEEDENIPFDDDDDDLDGF